MSRRYRRYRRYNSYRGGRARGTPLGGIIILFLLAVSFFGRYWHFILGIGIVIVLIYMYLSRNKSKSTEESAENEPAAPQPQCDYSAPSQKSYTSKTSIMTDCEKAFFDVFAKLLHPNYIVQPQINLASVINKEAQSRYQNELFRNIDFGVFDNNYSLKLLIEINDQSHTQRSRIERDNKVKAICAEAGIPLVTFWTKYGINEQYIRKRLDEYLSIPENITTDHSV